MIAKFSLIGSVHEILPKHQTVEGESITIVINAIEAMYYVVAIGKIMDVVSRSVKQGDLIYVDGKLRIDRKLLTSAPKNVCIMFANHLNVIREGD